MTTTFIIISGLLAAMLFAYLWRMAMMRRRIPWWKKLLSSRAANGGSATIATVIEAALGGPGSPRRSLIYALACLTAGYTLFSLRSHLRRSLIAPAGEASKATAVYPMRQRPLRNASMTLARDAE